MGSVTYMTVAIGGKMKVLRMFVRTRRQPVAPSIVQTAAVALIWAMVCLAPIACTQAPNNDQEIRQKTAEATRDAKAGAKDLAQQTKEAAAKAVDGVNAAAQGVRDGLAPDSAHPLDINSASVASIATLPGISLTKAHDIVKGRPYSSPHQLVSKGLLTPEQYSKISDRVVAR
jgi:DNA uptake protein ComE-like DNA-binding protein